MNRVSQTHPDRHYMAQVPENGVRDDDDSWLHVTPGELDFVLHRRWGQPPDPTTTTAGQSADLRADVSQAAGASKQEMPSAVPPVRPSEPAAAVHAEVDELQALLRKMAGFMHMPSSFEGAEIPQGLSAADWAALVDDEKLHPDDDENADDEDDDEEEEMEDSGEEDNSASATRVSSQHGAVRMGDEPVQLDSPEAFMKALQNILGPSSAPPVSAAAAPARVSPGLADDASISQLAAMMEAELRDSTLAKSFVTQAQSPDNVASAPSTGSAAIGQEDTSTMTPVDVDLNLVSNLLQSFESQQVCLAINEIIWRGRGYLLKKWACRTGLCLLYGTVSPSVDPRLRVYSLIVIVQGMAGPVTSLLGSLRTQARRR